MSPLPCRARPVDGGCSGGDSLALERGGCHDHEPVQEELQNHLFHVNLQTFLSENAFKKSLKNKILEVCHITARFVQIHVTTKRAAYFGEQAKIPNETLCRTSENKA